MDFFFKIIISVLGVGGGGGAGGLGCSKIFQPVPVKHFFNTEDDIFIFYLR
jgi:hypothetical protein